MRIRSIQISDGGVPKTSVPEVWVSRTGLSGDRQRDQRHHGGPDRAVSVYAWERIVELAAEGHSISPGSTGENLTIEGVRWEKVVPGAVLTAGTGDDRVELEVTAFAIPCRNVAGSFKNGDFSRIGEKIHPGWSRVYCRVLREGRVRTGDPIDLQEAGANRRSSSSMRDPT